MPAAIRDPLRNVPLFATLAPAERLSIRRVTRRVTVETGDVLCRHGDPGLEMWIVLDGEAKVERGGRTLRRLRAGDHFGELALLDRGSRSATVQAVTPMQLLVIGEFEFTTLLDEVPALAKKLLAALAGRVRELDKQLNG